jgi:hypothetical protein
MAAQYILKEKKRSPYRRDPGVVDNRDGVVVVGRDPAAHRQREADQAQEYEAEYRLHFCVLVDSEIGVGLNNIGKTKKGNNQRVTRRCRLSLLTNSALVYESQCGGMGGGGGCGVSAANEYSWAHHVTWSPNKLWRSTSIFNLCE